MSLPSPNLTFIIPSLHDKLPLDCRIFLPNDFRNRAAKIRAAVFAHPYAPLGGSYDDFIVGIVSKELISHGAAVCTFNFRGAGESKGSNSWTGKPEVQDYISAAGCLLHFLNCLSIGNGTLPTRPKISMIFGGYSYGSHIASRLPDVPGVVQNFILSAVEGESAALTVLLRAEHLARVALEEDRNNQSGHHETTLSVGGDEGLSNRRSVDSRRSTDHRPSLDAILHPLKHHRGKAALKAQDPLPSPLPRPQPFPEPENISAAYLLVSPILPPLSYALSFSLNGATSDENMKKLRTLPALAIWGTEDSFVSAKRLRSWAQSIQTVNPKFVFEEIEAGHFYTEMSFGIPVWKELVDRLSGWLDRLYSDDDKVKQASL